MVILHVNHGLSMFGDGSDGAGPNAGDLNSDFYSYTSWTVGGAVTFSYGGGATVRVLGDVTVTGSISVVSATVAATWGGATDGGTPAGGGATATVANRYNTFMSYVSSGGEMLNQKPWAGFYTSGKGGLQSGVYGKSRGRLVIIAGGKITLSNAGGTCILANGALGVAGNGTHAGGGGGGGMVCLISNTGIEVATGSMAPAINCYGGNGGNGSATKYSGGGGGGGAVLLFAPYIDHPAGSYFWYAGGAHGTGSTMAGAGNGGGGGGSFGAGGNGGTAGTANGADGSAGALYELEIQPMKLF